MFRCLLGVRILQSLLPEDAYHYSTLACYTDANAGDSSSRKKSGLYRGHAQAFYSTSHSWNYHPELFFQDGFRLSLNSSNKFVAGRDIVDQPDDLSRSPYLTAN